MAKLRISAFFPALIAGFLLSLGGNALAAGGTGNARAVVDKAPKQSSYLDDLIARARNYLATGHSARDAAKAAALLKEGVRAGDSASMLLLARLYATGDGIAPDFERARLLLEQAISAGD